MKRNLLLGFDMGSTTLKCVVLEKKTLHPLFSQYVRHEGEPSTALITLSRTLQKHFGDALIEIAFTGSQSSDLAPLCDAAYIQEVLASSLAVQERYPTIRTVVELGGQDAKLLFFNPEGGVEDMRMNGVCAGGTGAFLDQIATLIDTPIEQFNTLAEKGSTLYDISGRCGVFAKTDIQPLLNQGVPREDIALSCFHALVKQIIGGLAQGTSLKAPLLFAGGPLFFMPRLRKVFAELLGISGDTTIIPEDAETFVAYGTAVSLVRGVSQSSGQELSLFIKKLEQAQTILQHTTKHQRETQPFFLTEQERNAFEQRYALTPFVPPSFKRGTCLEVFIGIDAGSTTTKFVVINAKKELLYRFYESNRGTPLKTAQQGLLTYFDMIQKQGVDVVVKGLGTTGYGELLFAKAFGADYHTVETIAHKEAACHYEPEATFVLDLGGQDMKAIFIEDGVITDITLNEACSAGCGSFIESYASALSIAPSEVAQRAFSSLEPSVLGSRCTVFMNSSIISEQKRGKGVNEILGGLCNSIIENLFTKVIRLNHHRLLGDKIVVQGGTFKNDAILRAFTQYIGQEVVRPPYVAEMGALGIAFLVVDRYDGSRKSHFIGYEKLQHFSYSSKTGSVCPYCANSCERTILTFEGGVHFVTGNRCERGEVVEEKPLEDRKQYKNDDTPLIPNMMREREALLRTFGRLKCNESSQTIGIPFVLDFFDSLPFWATLFHQLGYNVVLSHRSSNKLFEQGRSFIPSDTVCLPAKLSHGHIEDLCKQGVDTIFFPAMKVGISENKSVDDSRFCALLQGYPEVIRQSYGATTPLLVTPTFMWHDEKLKKRQVLDFIETTFGIKGSVLLQAYEEAQFALGEYQQTLLDRGKEILGDLRRRGQRAVVLSGRPYHGDSFINHGVADIFVQHKIPVLINENFDVDSIDVSAGTIDMRNIFHSRMVAIAHIVKESSALEMVQIVSFGCGHDAVLSDELQGILKGHKTLLSLKLDESESKGPLKIRVASFIETMQQKSKQKSLPSSSVIFTHSDRHKEILLPNLSRALTMVMGEALIDQGFTIRVLPYATRRAIDLGKQYVHNDICFPAQINIGEHLAWLEEHPDSVNSVAVMLAKNCTNCRAGHYSSLARRALDSAGYSQVPLVTTDFDDLRGIHPGFKINELHFRLFSIRGFALIDALDDMVRKCRPYEEVVGSADALYEEHCQIITQALRVEGWRGAQKRLGEAIDAFNTLKTDRQVRKPRVGIIGEILVNYHEAGNYHMVEYLEQNGMEVVLPSVIEFWRQESVNWRVMAQRGHTAQKGVTRLKAAAHGLFFSHLLSAIEKQMQKFKYYEPHSDIETIAQNAAEVIDVSYTAGEGWLIPGEIISWIKEGITTHFIIQPFGCLPNHISGRGIMGAIKEKYPQASITSLDFDPDTSIANIHNRIQMVILQRQRHQRKQDR